jgi:DNA-binding NtrC family response regulator
MIPSPPRHLTSSSQPMARILVLDDDPSVRTAVHRILEREGHTVLERSKSIGALEFWRTNGADLIITDVYMPDRDGIELLLEFRAEAPRLPFVVMSGGGVAGNLDSLKDAMLLGAVHTLAKPFSRDELLAAVSHALGAEM